MQISHLLVRLAYIWLDLKYVVLCKAWAKQKIWSNKSETDLCSCCIMMHCSSCVRVNVFVVFVAMIMEISESMLVSVCVCQVLE